MMKGGHGQTNQLHDINWGALNRHASCSPQLMFDKTTLEQLKILEHVHATII